MKYSILMPYLKRYEQFRITLMTYEHFCGSADIEFIIGEDVKNYNDADEHNKLIELISLYSDKFKINHFVNTCDSLNPARTFNHAAKLATGEMLVLTNPEIAILNDVFSIIDTLPKTSYIVGCCCSAIKCTEHANTLADFDYTPHMYYQHSIYGNRLLHFFSVISRENYFSIGGFDENYLNGIGYEDDDFRDTVKKFNIPIIPRDDIKTIHIEHDRNYQSDNNKVNINRQYYSKKWGVYV